VFAGGSYEEVARWLLGFVNSHAKREHPAVEGVVERAGGTAGRAFAIRLRLGDRYEPPLEAPPVELPFEEVAQGKGRFDWCQEMAGRVRGWARGLAERREVTRR
jgi:hypothetical protein